MSRERLEEKDAARIRRAVIDTQLEYADPADHAVVLVHRNNNIVFLLVEVAANNGRPVKRLGATHVRSLDPQKDLADFLKRKKIRHAMVLEARGGISRIEHLVPINRDFSTRQRPVYN